MASVRRVLERTLSAPGQRGQERGRPAVEPYVPRLHVHQAPAEPASGAREGPAGVQSEGASDARAAHRGRTIRQIVPELRQLMLGWRAFFGFAEGRSPRRDLDRGSGGGCGATTGSHGAGSGTGSCERRGVGRQLAWNTVKSAHGPWRLRQRPALAMALPQRDFATRGLPRLREG